MPSSTVRSLNPLRAAAKWASRLAAPLSEMLRGMRIMSLHVLISAASRLAAVLRKHPLNLMLDRAGVRWIQ